MTKEELEKEVEEYTKNLLKKLGIKEDMLLENQPKYLRQESMNFVALDVENVTDAYLAGAEPREKRIEELEELLINSKRLSDTIEKAQKKQISELEAQIEQLQKINNEQKETLKKVRVALIQERTANIMNYGKGGVEMFDSMFEILKGVSN